MNRENGKTRYTCRLCLAKLPGPVCDYCKPQLQRVNRLLGNADLILRMRGSVLDRDLWQKLVAGESVKV